MTKDQIAASKRTVKRNPKVSQALLKKVRKTIQKTMEDNKNTENTSGDNTEIEMIDVMDMVPVKKTDLDAIIHQNLEQKKEIGALVGLFLNFETLFTGNAGIGSLITLIPKLLSDPAMKEKVESILPIIQKYK